MRTTIIFNPYAGRLRRNPQRLTRAVEILQQAGDEVTLCATTGPNTAGALARAAAEGGTERILVAGGDGTLNEAVNGMAGCQVPLGILPAGTANVLATELKLGRTPVDGAKRLADCEAVPVAVGRLTNAAGVRYFLCMLGAGLDADIVRRVSPQTKRRLGKLSYWVGGLAQVGRRLPEFDVKMNGTTVRTSYALLSRVANYGGDLEIARHANLRDPRLGVVLFAGSSSLAYLKYFSGVVLNALEGMKGVTVTHTTAAEIDGTIPLQVDGEDAGDGPATVDLVPDGIRLLMPRTARNQKAGRKLSTSMRSATVTGLAKRKVLRPGENESPKATGLSSGLMIRERPVADS